MPFSNKVSFLNDFMDMALAPCRRKQIKKNVDITVCKVKQGIIFL